MQKLGIMVAAAGAIGLVQFFPGIANAKTINVGVGHQSMCTDTYTAGIIVKELGLLDKEFGRTEERPRNTRTRISRSAGRTTARAARSRTK